MMETKQHLEKCLLKNSCEMISEMFEEKMQIWGCDLNFGWNLNDPLASSIIVNKSQPDVSSGIYVETFPSSMEQNSFNSINTTESLESRSSTAKSLFASNKLKEIIFRMYDTLESIIYKMERILGVFCDSKKNRIPNYPETSALCYDDKENESPFPFEHLILYENLRPCFSRYSLYVHLLKRDTLLWPEDCAIYERLESKLYRVVGSCREAPTHEMFTALQSELEKVKSLLASKMLLLNID